MTTAGTLTQKRIAWFFFPLLLNVQLMSVSHSVINAALARLPEAVTALASFSVAMVVHLLVASPSYQNHNITIALVRSRYSLRNMTFFVLLVAAYVSTMLALIAHTVVGNWVLGGLLGVHGQVAQGAREALGMMAFLPLFTGFRGLFQGLVIRAQRTMLVSLATGIRIGALLLFILVGRPWFSGAELGAFALLMCIVVEASVMGLFAWRHRLPPESLEERSFRGTLAFAVPVAFSSGLQQTIPVVITAIIGRLPDAEKALAGFGVIRGLLFMLGGPMRNLQQAYLTLVHNHSTMAALKKFYWWVAALLAGLTLLLALPLNPLVLGRIIGLTTDMRLYLSLPLVCCALFPFFYGAVNLLRGCFTGAGRTGVLGQATGVKFAYLLCCWLAHQLLPQPLPGIGLAIFLLLSAEGFEGLFLAWQKRRQHLTYPS